MNQISDELNVNKRVSYCITSKRTLLQWCMPSTDPPGIMFVGFFREKCLLTIAKYKMVIPACLHCMQGKHLMRN